MSKNAKDEGRAYASAEKVGLAAGTQKTKGKLNKSCNPSEALNRSQFLGGGSSAITLSD